MNKLVFFDVDGTLVKGQTQKILADFLFKNNYLSGLVYIKIILWFMLYKLNFIKSTSKFREKILRLFTGKDRKEWILIFRKCFEEMIKPKIYSQSIELINKHIRDKDKIILISASLHDLLLPLAEYVGSDDLIATKLEVKNNFYTGNIEGIAIYSDNKKKIIEETIQNGNYKWEDVYFYTDHYSDLPVLEIVGNPKVVNPDKYLKKIAKIRGWQIYEFR